MGIIRRLPPSVINQIAAGEVVERPSSVVKELLENAIDAGATRIDVTVERGGKDLIRVADDGKGMAPEDLPLAFQPHATSKLAEADDLFRIATLGFRGEALAAIAEVAKVRCQTRRADASEGSELVVEGGVAGEVQACGGPPGTVIEVRNLFFNTPVRRTFLKSDSTEAGHVSDAFWRVALAQPTVHFTFRSSGKVLHELPAATGVKERIAVALGQELADSLLWIENRVDATHLWGYVAHPSQSRSSAKGQFLFVGGRYVRDRSLGHALSEAYRGLLMVGRAPVAFLHLDLPAEEVDVNIHPAKIEVRFRDSQRIYSLLLSTVRQTFLASDLHARLQAPGADPSTSKRDDDRGGFGLSKGTNEHQDVASWFSPGSPTSFQTFPAPGYAGGPTSPAWGEAPLPGPSQGWKESFDEFAPVTPADSPAPPEVEAGLSSPQSATSAPAAVAEAVLARGGPLKALQVHDSYLVAETNDGMVVIDQHALHERILYEELRMRVERGSVESQRLLVPEPVDLTAAEASGILEQREALGRLGLEVEPFGGDTVLVASMPAMLKGVAADRLLRDLADHFLSEPLPPSRDKMLEALLNMVACKAAVKAGQRLSAEEIGALLDRRHLVSDSHHCPHGRPTALIFTKAELERQFGRI